MLPHPPHPRQVVLELRELDLELALGADGVLGEDVEDQLRPVDDACLQRVLEELLLRRVELVVDEQGFRPGLLVGGLQLLHLPLADVGARGGMRPALHELAHGLDARGAGELVDLGELSNGVGPGRQHGEDEAALGCRAGRRLGLAIGHRGIMPRC